MSIDDILADIRREQDERSAASAASARATAQVEEVETSLAATERVAARHGLVPPRFKPEEDWSVPEVLEHRASGRRPETDAYREHRRRALEAAGLADEAAELDAPPVEGMSVADHLAQIRRH